MRLATEERLWNQGSLSVTQRGHTHEMWDVCGSTLLAQAYM